MKAIKLATCLGLALAMSASPLLSADQPSTQPATIASPAQGAGPLRRILRGLVGARSALARPYTPEEWEAAQAFFKANSPHRAEALQSLGAKVPDSLRMELVLRLRNYNLVKEHLPAVADLALKQFRIEDDIFQLSLQRRQDPANAKKYADQIRDEVRQSVDIGFQEREARIANLRRMLADESQVLSRDKSQEEQIIQRRTDRILSGPQGGGASQPSQAGTGK